MNFVSSFVVFLAAVRCVTAQATACCPAVYIYQPDLIPPQKAQTECEVDRAGLVPFEPSTSGEWRVQSNWTASDAGRFLNDFNSAYGIIYWKYTNGSDVDPAQRVATFYMTLTPDVVFPNINSSGSCFAGLCESCQIGLQDLALVISSLVVIVADPSVNDAWQTWLTGAWADVNVRNALLTVVQRSSAAYVEDVRTGLALLDSGRFSNCSPCDAPTTTTTTTVTTTTTTTVTTITSTGVAGTTGTGMAGTTGTGMAGTTGTGMAGTTSTGVAGTTGAGVATTPAAVAGKASAVGYGAALMASVAVGFGMQLSLF